MRSDGNHLDTSGPQNPYIFQYCRRNANLIVSILAAAVNLAYATWLAYDFELQSNRDCLAMVQPSLHFLRGTRRSTHLNQQPTFIDKKNESYAQHTIPCN